MLGSLSVAIPTSDSSFMQRRRPAATLAFQPSVYAAKFNGDGKRARMMPAAAPWRLLQSWMGIQ
jgi:hypothetical protein